MRIKAWVGISMMTAVAIGSALPAVAKEAKVVGPGGNILATASFTPQGDIFHVDDRRKDGRGAYVFWNVPGSGTGTCKDSDGAASRPTTCNYNFAENKDFSWVLCAIDVGGDGKTKCTALINDNTSRP